jgi:hypothetical protein
MKKHFLKRKTHTTQATLYIQSLLILLWWLIVQRGDTKMVFIIPPRFKVVQTAALKKDVLSSNLTYSHQDFVTKTAKFIGISTEVAKKMRKSEGLTKLFEQENVPLRFSTFFSQQLSQHNSVESIKRKRIPPTVPVKEVSSKSTIPFFPQVFVNFFQQGRKITLRPTQTHKNLFQ